MNRQSEFLAIAVCALLIAACDNSTAPETPRISVLSTQGPCDAVRGTITAQSFPGGAVGTIHGDLEGTITSVLEPDPVGATEQYPTGRVFRAVGYQTVDVAGGSIPRLTGRTIVWTIDSRAVVVSPSMAQVSNTLRIVEGGTGNLVTHGILELVTFTTNFDYQGEICP